MGLTMLLSTTASAVQEIEMNTLKLALQNPLLREVAKEAAKVALRAIIRSLG
jgi:hypothetical protein